jgi:5'-3' exoribonuclease 1
MGIPSYFSYIIKNYSNIIRQYRHIPNVNGVRFQYLLMDCNSIIYDEFRKMEELRKGEEFITKDMENCLIRNVIKKISEYISYISPTKLVYIAFDGVAPLAKMEQQRTRRYKSSVLSKINAVVSKKNNVNNSWSTSNITPGTDFMKNLTKQINKSFKGLDKHYNVKQIIVSGTDECGEGEHKMFKHLRQSNIKVDETVAVYGLDSDLIMLSVFHCKYAKNIFIFREKPEFGKHLIPSSANEEDEYLFLNIHTFSRATLEEMHCDKHDAQRLYDYIFMCFFLGNDFLPHFPSLNIRTTGIDTLLTSYRNLIGKYSDRRFISNDNEINWKWVSLFIKELAKTEHERILGEYELREKWGKRKWLADNDDNRDFTVQSVPVIYRAEENYIAPKERSWERRYYNTLFQPDINVESVCINYLEGLEWVFKYYTVDCPHWKWRYQYHYPPLLTDLTKFVPNNSYDFITNDSTNSPFSENVQLAYVLPPANHGLLLSNVKRDLDTLYSQYSVTEFSFQWAFCRYFWEAHAILPEVSIDVLHEWDQKWATAPKKSRIRKK